MNTEDRAAYTAGLFAALRYPDDTLADLVPAIGERRRAPSRARLRLPLSTFLDYFDATTAQEVQRHYVATFDMRRKCSPYLTYWTHGDTRNRGMALLRFKQTYRESGVDLDEQELPDHLAVVLEFAAFGDTELGNALLAEHRGAIDLLRDALDDVESPYGMCWPSLATTSALTPEDEVLMSSSRLPDHRPRVSAWPVRSTSPWRRSASVL